MVCFPHRRRLWPVVLAVMLLAAAAASQDAADAQAGASQPAQSQAPAESGKPLPLKPDLPGMARNHRLILKDGTYQVVREYQILGDRVRYYSEERGDWEELPVSLVDWDATRKWEQGHAGPGAGEPSPAMEEAAAIDKEEADERNDQKARMPDVAPGLELPDQDGVFALDTYQGAPELVELAPKDLDLEAKTRHGIGILNPLAVGREGLILDGQHAKVHLHVNEPAFYLSLKVEGATEPVLSDPITVNTSGGTGGARDAVNGDHGAHSAQSRFVVVQVEELNAGRLVGAIRMSPNGAVVHNGYVIPTKVEVLPGKHWMRVQPLQTLLIGEYVLVEILSPTAISPTVWDFGVDPATGDNPGSLGPILSQNDNP